jgi:hypothetical protein
MDRRSQAPSCGDLRQADETKAHAQHAPTQSATPRGQRLVGNGRRREWPASGMVAILGLVGLGLVRVAAGRRESFAASQAGATTKELIRRIRSHDSGDGDGDEVSNRQPEAGCGDCRRAL